MNNTFLSYLLIEDQPGDRMMIRKAIEGSGFPGNITEASNIDDAIDLCRKQEFDCIFLDYYFPESTGAEFLRYYNNSGSHGCVIVVTCQDDVNMAVECMKNGAIDYLPKSLLNTATITRCITNAMRINDVRKTAEQTEKALLESEMRLRSIIGKSPIIFFTIERSGEISLFKGKSASVLSIRPEEVVGKNISELDELLPIHNTDFKRALKGEQFQSTAEINQHHFEVNYIPVKGPDRNISTIMGVAIDITSFKKNEVTLMNNLEVVEAASRIKEQFLANMSHEIRTPIHGIISLTQFILKTSLTEDQGNYLNLIRKSADTLLVIVNDILDLSKLEADKMTFEEVDFHLQDTVRSAVAAFIPKTIEKGIELRTQFPTSCSEYINGDPVRLVQIINNLLGNAVKFTEKGSVSLEIKVNEQNEDHLVLEFEIKDSGIGIPSNKISSIFDNFTQAGSDTARKYGGTGLGLSITRRLIEKQNGMIHVTSEHGSGSTFTFRLPYRITKGEVNNNSTQKENSSGLPSNLRILVAEDNDINRFILQKMLKQWNVEPVFAETGSEAVEKASAAEFDIILMDIEMPGMNGYKATEIIRNEFTGPMRNVPIVAMTGHAMQGERQKCMQAGMTDYLSKPFQPEDLRALILKLTTGSESPVQNTAVAETVTVSAERCTDLTFLREISDGNEQFFREFLEMFIANTPPALKDMQDAYRNKEWEKLRQVAHKMKPSFNYIGLKELNQLSARVEELAKNACESVEIETMINRILVVSQIALAELKTELSNTLQSK